MGDMGDVPALMRARDPHETDNYVSMEDKRSKCEESFDNEFGSDILAQVNPIHAYGFYARGWNAALQHATDKLNEEAPDASAQDTTNASIEE